MDSKDYENLGLTVFSGEEDSKAIENFILKAIPLFNGMSISQAEKATERLLEAFKCGYIIKA